MNPVSPLRPYKASSHIRFGTSDKPPASEPKLNPQPVTPNTKTQTPKPASIKQRLQYLGIATIYPFMVQAPKEYDKRTQIGFRILAVVAWPVVFGGAVKNLFTGKIAPDVKPRQK